MSQPIDAGDESRALRVLLIAALAAKLAFLVYYARNLAFIMDEFAQGYTGRFVDQGLYTHVQPTKTILPLLAFRAAIGLGSNAVDVLRWFRFETLLAAIAMVAATALIAQRLYRSANAGLLSAFVLLCFSSFIEHAGSVRNDSFAMLFCVLAFGALLWPVLSARTGIVSGVLVGVAFLCTQKVAYHVVALGLGLGVRAWLEAGARGAARTLAHYGLGCAISIAAYCVGFGGLHASNVLYSVFLAPLQSPDHVLTNEAFPGIERYVAQTLDRNMFAYGLCAVGGLLTIARARSVEPSRIGGVVATAVVTLFIFKHPQPWPYVFVLCTPLLALWAPALFERWQGTRRTAAMAAAAVLLAVSFARNIEIMGHDNRTQLAVVGEAEALLAPKDRYFDGVGMIPTRDIAGDQPWWWWDSPTLNALRKQITSGDRANFDSILRDQPKLWILNYRFGAMRDVLNPILQGGTIQITPHIMISGRHVPAGSSTAFSNYWSGNYRWIDLKGHEIESGMRLDGQACPAPCKIGLGEHAVSSTTTIDALLIPADIKLPTRPAQPLADTLFSNVYDF